MGRQRESLYAGVTDFGSSSDVELAFLPPTAAGRTKKQADTDTITLLHGGDKSLPPAYGAQIKNTPSIPTQSWFADWRLGRYVRLGSGAGDPDEVGSPFRGWRKAVIAAAAVTGLVLLINTVFAIVALIKFTVSDGVGIIYTGDCGLVKRWDTALHLMINVLGTALLAASSFTMQCLSSPTRSELNDAHAKRVSLEIGIASFKNLFYMRAWKGVLWALLCLSTLPLHLLWNSTIFSTSGTNLFSYVIAEESFLTGATYQEPDDKTSYCTGYVNNPDIIKRIYSGYQNGTYDKLSVNECISSYVETELLNTRRNLIMIAQQPSTSTNMSTCGYNGQLWNGSSVAAMDTDANPGTYWLYDYYDRSPNVSVVTESVQSDGTWRLGNFTVDSCWSEATQVSQCRLQFVSYILYVVVGCNTVKFICMIIAARYLWNLDEPILATVGDAVASFLEQEDGMTTGWCLLDLQSLRGWRHIHGKDGYDSTYKRQPKTRLYSATTLTRWWSTMILCTLYLIAGFVLFRLSFGLSSYNMSQAMKMRFGAVDSGMILGLDGESGAKLILDVVVANSFQLALSTTYFLYNSLYTAQCAALEWATYAHGKRKTLRVTWPRGQQRSTYYLQLPYRYGIPLTILLVLMHFLISQSIFLARLQYYDSEGELTKQGFSDVGFSPRATLTTCCVGVVMILAQVLHACRPLDNRIPIHGNNSAVISAVCHTEKDPANKLRRPFSSDVWEEDNIATKPIMWGVTRQPLDQDVGLTKDERAGHCGFSADIVELPQVGKHYK